MTILVFHVVFPATLTWWMMPRVYLLFDRRVARGRLGPYATTTSHPIPAIASGSPRETPPSDAVVELSSMCDTVARLLKSGRPAPEAFTEAIERAAIRFDSWSAVRSDLLAGVTTRDALLRGQASMPTGSDERLCADLLVATLVGLHPVIGGVEHAASVLRDVASTRADLRVATAQARLSARILTMLPLAVLAGGFVINSAFRESLLSVSVLLPLVIGIALNRTGWRWITHLLNGVTETAQRFELAEIVDTVCVSLMAGSTLTQACEFLGDGNAHCGPSVGGVISGRVREGRPLSECLEPLGTTFGLQGRLFADVLTGADRDGLPVVATVARIAQDVRIERRRRVDTAIRQMPVKLTIPLVTCVLPGFLLTTLVPLVASSVGALTVHLPGVPTPFSS